jgi:hypothetical protein
MGWIKPALIGLGASTVATTAVTATVRHTLYPEAKLHDKRVGSDRAGVLEDVAATAGIGGLFTSPFIAMYAAMGSRPTLAAWAAPVSGVVGGLPVGIVGAMMIEDLVARWNGPPPKIDPRVPQPKRIDS